MSFLLRFPSDREAPFSGRERMAIWRVVGRGYRRDMLRLRSIWILVVIIVVLLCVSALRFGMK